LRAGRRAPCRAACEVWVPPSRRPPPSLPAPCGVGASFGFSLQGVLLASIGSPLGGLLPSWRCPRGFASPPWGACERGRLQGFDPDASSFRPSRPEGRDAPMPSWDSSLQSVLPLPPTLALSVARDPLSRRVGSTSRSVRVSGCCGGARSADPSRGCRLSWALLTLRRLRPRCDRVGGRAHGFASRRARVACGACLSVPPRRRSGGGFRLRPMPASFGERLLPVPFVRACCQRTELR